MTAPNLEERLSAAAYVILTDGNDHDRQAQRWAVRFLRRAARGRPTAFQRGQLSGALVVERSGDSRLVPIVAVDFYAGSAKQ